MNNQGIKTKTIIVIVLVFIVIAFVVQNLVLFVLLAAIVAGAIALYNHTCSNTKKGKAEEQKKEKAQEEEKQKAREGYSKYVAEEGYLMIVYTGNMPLVITEILDPAEFTSVWSAKWNKTIEMVRAIRSVNNGETIPHTYQAVVDASKENWEVAYKIHDLFNKYVNTNNDLVLLASEDKSKVIFARGTCDNMFDEDNLFYLNNANDLKKFEEFSPDLKEYRDMFGNRVEFKSKPAGTKHWQNRIEKPSKKVI